MDLKSWSQPDLVNYLEFLIHDYRDMDAFWFINIEQAHGLAKACRINEQVWGKVSGLAACDLKQRLGRRPPHRLRGGHTPVSLVHTGGLPVLGGRG